MEKFFNEINLYRGPLALGMKKVLGAEGARQALAYYSRLEQSGAYTGNFESLKKVGAFFVGSKDDLGFYVITGHDDQTRYAIEHQGIIFTGKARIHARPVFYFTAEAVQKASGQVPSNRLPRYFTPWLHEFGHFLCYWLQERPLMVATGLITGRLDESGFKLSSLEDLSPIASHNAGGFLYKLARLLVLLVSVNEAMAVWLQERLLEAMEFDAGDYFDPQKTNNPYIQQLQRLNTQAGLDYVRMWHRPEYYEDLFTKNFMKSFEKVQVDRWGFLPISGNTSFG